MTSESDTYLTPPRGHPLLLPGASAGLGRIVLSLALCLCVLTPAFASTGEHGRLGADFSYGRISGDYDTGEESDLDTFVTRLRWKFERGEVRISLPYLRLSGAGNLTVTPGGPIGNGNGNGNGNDFSSLAATGDTATTQGIGDVRMRAEWHAVRGGADRPWITLLGEVKAPTASESEGLGTGKTDLKAGVGLMHPVVPRTYLLADVGYTRMGDPDEVDYQDVVSLGAGLSRKLGSRTGRYAFAYLEHRSHPLEGRAARMDVQLGASTRLGARQRDKLSGSVLVGLSATAQDYGFVLSYGRTF